MGINAKELVDSIMRLLKIILLLFIISCAEDLSAQYYSWGADAPMKWSRIEGDRVQVVYPDTTSALAHRVLCYINAVQPDIAYGWDFPALNIPFVIHPQNFSSNGLVMWMPKRIEFISTPATDGYSMLWSKQLVAHEYRHAVQYNNLNRHWVKAFSYILGQQGAVLGFAFMPLFAIEGDAVMIETEMSTYGRGKQPSFSMEYRAIGEELFEDDRKNVDKWFCGSYRENIPDHYRLGYQFMSYTYEKYGENVWNKAIQYTTRNPYMVYSMSSGLKKVYNTNIEKLSREAFAELKELWRPLSCVPNSTEQISQTDSTTYTTYSHPIALEDGGVLALKQTFDKTPRFVVRNKEGEERTILKIGSLSTRPAYSSGRVWWTEYRRSKLFDEKVASQLCYMDLDKGGINNDLNKGKSRWVRGASNVLYPVVVDNKPDHIAYVEYLPSGHYRIIERDADQITKVLSVDFPAEVHGLAWDNMTRKLYVIITDHSGMWLGEEREGGFEPLYEGRYITISNLRAEGGVLYFGSIASGLDELHSFEIATSVERQITSSTYGSFQPSTPKGGYIYATTYDKYGYHLARQSADSVVGEVSPALIPINKVNPKRRSLGLINLDSVRYDVADSTHIAEHSPSKRYHKGCHLIDVHSWAPVRFNPFEILDEQNLDIGLGATLLSQNLLSSCESYLSYGWNRSQGSVVSGSMTYTGLGVNLSVGASWGGDRMVYGSYSGGDDLAQSSSSLDGYYSKHVGMSAMASLPLYFQRGYMTRQLTLWGGWNYSNSLIEDFSSSISQSEPQVEYQSDSLVVIQVDLQSASQSASQSVQYNRGLHKLTFGAGFGNYARAAYRDIKTPLGYYASVNYTLNPTNSDFKSLVSGYAKLYLPGVLPHNSLTLAANYQTSFGDGLLTYSGVSILPRGYYSSEIYNNNYIASAFEYELPVWYPDGGIENMVYFKRINAKFEAEYAQFEYMNNIYRLHSYGGGVVVDMNFVRLPNSGTVQAEFSIYKPKGKSLGYEVGFALPF